MALIFASETQVIRNGQFSLGTGQDATERLQWFVPEGFHFPMTPNDLALMSFNIRADQAADVSLEAVGNGPTRIMKGRPFAQGFERAFMVSFDIRSIVVETGNTIGSPVGSLIFEFRAQNGPVRISEVAVHSKVAFEV